MRPVIHIFKREFSAYMVSPVAYIVISVFLIITGWFFFTPFFLQNQASLRNFFSLLPLVFSFVVPAITMRLLSEEFSVGSYETLLTLPVTFSDVILGKFLAATGFTAVMLAPTLLYPVTVSVLGTLDWGPVLGGYIGALLLGATFSAIGLLASSLTRNQIVAFIVGTAVCFSLCLIDKMLFFLPQSLLGFFEYLGADFHFQNIAKGILDTRDILYFISVGFIGLYGANLVMQEKC
jgi:ABC-2 type transport system permease protein